MLYKAALQKRMSPALLLSNFFHLVFHIAPHASKDLYKDPRLKAAQIPALSESAF